MCYRNVFSYNEQLGIAQQFIITFNLMFCVILLCHSQTRLAITGRTYQHVGHEGHHLAGELPADVAHHAPSRLPRSRIFKHSLQRHCASDQSEAGELSRQL